MAVMTIAGLTLKEAVRRRTLVGAFLLGLLVLGLSLLLILIRTRLENRVAIGRLHPADLGTQYAIARSVLTNLCLSFIRFLSSLFAVLLAGGAISGEIERGLLAVILSKPVPRWQILLGKWIGLNIILIGSVLLWSVMAWASFTMQTGEHLKAILTGGLYLTLFPVVICTVTLTFSTITQRLFGTSLALTVTVFAWFDGILESLGRQFDVDSLHFLANVAGLVMPQGYIAWWVEDATSDIIHVPGGRLGISPRFLNEWGRHHLNGFAHLDVVYVVLYILVVLIAGMILFHKRDV